MLVQMEGCDPNSADRRVLLVGATNRPEVAPKPLHTPEHCQSGLLKINTNMHTFELCAAMASAAAASATTAAAAAAAGLTTLILVLWALL